MKLEKVENGYKVLTDTNKQIGYFILDIDGSYYLRFEEVAGYWTSYSLIAIAKLLDEVNKPFDNEVADYFRRDFEERARVEYRQLLNESGMFFEFYPKLTGEWKKDKEEWFREFKKLEELRQQVKAKIEEQI